MKKGQHLVEFGIVAVVILGVCLLSVFFFGDSIASVFENNNMLKIFNKGRTSNQIDPKSLLSNVNVTVNGEDITAPAEKIIRKNLLNGSYIQTSGSSGNVLETVEIIQEYISQLEGMLNKLPSGSQYNNARQGILDAIALFKGKVDSYIDLHGEKVQGTDDPLVRLADALDISVNLDENGDAAKNLNEAISNLNDIIPDGEYKNLLNVYSEGILNLGKSLDFTLDSRLYKELGVEAYIAEVKAQQLAIIESIKSLFPVDEHGNPIGHITDLFKGNSAISEEFNDFVDRYEHDGDMDLITMASKDLSTELPLFNVIMNGELFGNIPPKPIPYPSYATGYSTSNISGASFSGTELTISVSPNYFTVKYCSGKKILKVGGTEWREVSQLPFTSIPNLPDFNTSNYTVLKPPSGSPADTYYLVANASYSDKSEDKKANGSYAKIIEVKCPTGGVACVPSVQNKYEYMKAADYNDLKTLKGKLSELASLSINANAFIAGKLRDARLTGAQKEAYAKQINVYRTGNYKDILPDSYNGDVLCSSINAVIKDNRCAANLSL